MEYKEISAKTVEEAITKASIELSTPSTELDIEIISQGSKGFLGIGSRPAVIRASVKEQKAVPETPVKKEKERSEKKPVKANKEEKVEAKHNDHKKEDFKKKNNNKKNHHNDNRKEENREAQAEHKRVDRREEIVIKTDEEIAELEGRAQKFLDEVFEAMSLKVAIKFAYVKEGGCLEIDLSGDDMGVLIGKRGQTLDSLQYLTSLVVNKGQKGFVRVKLDTEDYRKRRKDTLENLAKNIANKVRKTRKAVVLEPMNPYERRIIHSALQSFRDVETYSEGNEPYRHVVITPKK